MSVRGEQQLLDADPEDLGHLGQDVGAWGFLALFPVGDVRLRHAEKLGELDLSQAGLLAKVGEVLALLRAAFVAPSGHDLMIEAVFERTVWRGRKGLHNTSVLVLCRRIKRLSVNSRFRLTRSRGQGGSETGRNGPMHVTKEGIEQIKSANELARVVAERGIEVKRRGKSLVASCPFHEESTPSFTITPSKGLFHCFGCGVSGDVIGFVSRYEKIPFRRALETLARRAGLPLTEVMKERPRLLPKKSATSKAPTAPSPGLLSRVVEHYHKTLCEREDAQEYLRGRGLTDAQLALDFQLGYADGSLLKLVPKGERSGRSSSRSGFSPKRAGSFSAAASWSRLETP